MGQGVTKIGSYTILHSGTSSTQVHGVALVLSPKAASSWEAAGSVFIPVSERIIRIRVKTHFGFATIIAIYAPVNPTNTTFDARAPSDAFYASLHSALSSAPSRDMTIVLGDFNARVGSRSSQWSSVIGPYGPRELNENGEQLLDFCAGHDLIVSNTWFQHKPIHQLTWYRNGDRSKAGHLIDLVLVNRKFRSSLLDTRVFRCTHHQSDHELVISTIRFKIQTKRLHCKTSSHIQTQDLPRDVVMSFQSTLLDAHSTIHHTASPGVESIWTSFKDTIAAACNKLPRAPKRQEDDWVTDEVRNLSKKKKEAWVHLCNNRTPHTIVLYKRLCKLTRVAADKARSSWWSARAEEAEKHAAIAESLGCGGSLVRELRLAGRSAPKASASILHAVDGTVLTSDESKLRRWAEHFTSVTQCSSQVSEVVLEALPSIQPPSQNSPIDNEELCSPITEEEISTAIFQMKNGKASGLDGISSEVLKLGGKASVRWLSSIFTTIWQKQLLVPTLFNMFFDAVIRMAIDNHLEEGRGVRVVFHPDAKLIGDQKKMTLETLVSDLEYADDMALMSNPWSDLEVMIKSLHQHCTAMGLTINCKKTKTLAVLPSSSCPQPQPILLSPSVDPVEPVSAFQYLGSTVSQDCSNSAEVSSRIVKASQAFGSLNRRLWLQKRIKTVTKLRGPMRLLSSVPTLSVSLWPSAKPV